VLDDQASIYDNDSTRWRSVSPWIKHAAHIGVSRVNACCSARRDYRENHQRKTSYRNAPGNRSLGETIHAQAVAVRLVNSAGRSEQRVSGTSRHIVFGPVNIHQIEDSQRISAACSVAYRARTGSIRAQYVPIESSIKGQTIIQRRCRWAIRDSVQGLPKWNRVLGRGARHRYFQQL
jgi:hypothetical protein